MIPGNVTSTSGEVATHADKDWLRRQFPAFEKSRENKAVYLDSAATTFLPQCVIDAWIAFQSGSGGSPHRGVHPVAQDAATERERARSSIKRFFGGRESDELLFTTGVTDSLNLAAHALTPLLGERDRIVLSSLEHHSNYLPWLALAERTSASLDVVPLTRLGDLDYDVLERQLAGNGRRVVALTLCSNASGHLPDLERIAALLVGKEAYVILDGAQAAGHLELDFAKLPCHALAVSAHKMYGPKSVGGLLVRDTLLGQMAPFRLGGGMVYSVSANETEWHDGPRKFEAGTQDTGLALAWLEACRFIERLGWRFVEQRQRELGQQLRTGLLQLPSVRPLPGGARQSDSLLSFSVDGMHPHDVESALQKDGICVRTGHLCAQPALQQLGLVAVTRASFGIYNTADDVCALVDSLRSLTGGARSYASSHDGNRGPSAAASAFVVLPQVSVTNTGRACGDRFGIDLALENGFVSLATHSDCCSVAQQSAELLRRVVGGAKGDPAQRLVDRVLRGLKGTFPPAGGDVRSNEIDEARTLVLELRRMSRLDCATLPWEVCKAAFDCVMLPEVDGETAWDKVRVSCDACLVSSSPKWNQAAKRHRTHSQGALSMVRTAWSLGKGANVRDAQGQALGRLTQTSTKEVVQEFLRAAGPVQPTSIKSVSRILQGKIAALGLEGDVPPHLKAFLDARYVVNFERQRECDEVQRFVAKLGAVAVLIKGGRTKNLYADPELRNMSDTDLLTPDFDAAVSVAHALCRQKGYAFPSSGKIPFTVKVIVDARGNEVLTGHLHIYRSIHTQFDAIVDFNFPGIPLGLNQSLAFPSTDERGALLEEQFVITLTHLFKHETAYIKDLNDLFCLVQDSPALDLQRLGRILDQNDLWFLARLAGNALQREYGLSPSQRVLAFLSSGASPTEHLARRRVLAQGWPYSKGAQSMAQALDMLQRTVKRRGWLDGVREFGELITGQPMARAVSETRPLSQALGCSPNERVHLAPGVIFEQPLATQAFHAGLEKLTLKQYRIPRLMASRLVKQDAEVLLTPIGLFIVVRNGTISTDRARMREMFSRVLGQIGNPALARQQEGS